MTNLSKELCEICGIEATYKVMLDNTLMNITDDKNEAEVSAFESGGVIVDTYPDFEQPENFVKLFNTPIPNPYITISGFVTHYALSIWVTHDFLKRLVQLLKDKPQDFAEREIMLIKQAIREQEWVYG